MKILKNSNGQIVTYNNDPIIAEHTGITPLAYTVTFMVDGAVKYIISVDAGCSINEPPAFSDVTRAWTGWWPTDSAIGSKVSFPYTPNADVTIYGIFATTLAGQTWVLSCPKTIAGATGKFTINYTCNISNLALTPSDNIYCKLYLGYTSGTTAQYVPSSENNAWFPASENWFRVPSQAAFLRTSEELLNLYVISGDIGSTSSGRIVTWNFIDGTDINNLNLIRWLYTNATRTA